MTPALRVVFCSSFLLKESPLPSSAITNGLSYFQEDRGVKIRLDIWLRLYVTLGGVGRFTGEMTGEWWEKKVYNCDGERPLCGH